MVRRASRRVAHVSEQFSRSPSTLKMTGLLRWPSRTPEQRRGRSASLQRDAEVRALRDDLGERHREVVSTLERMRLDLLRLHAGAMSVEGVTTQLGMAKDVAQEVQRLLEARGELERLLKP